MHTCKVAHSFGSFPGLMVPSPNCPSSLSPQQYTSPSSVDTTQWREPQDIWVMIFDSNACTHTGNR